MALHRAWFKGSPGYVLKAPYLRKGREENPLELLHPERYLMNRPSVTQSTSNLDMFRQPQAPPCVLLNVHVHFVLGLEVPTENSSDFGSYFNIEKELRILRSNLATSPLHRNDSEPINQSERKSRRNGRTYQVRVEIFGTDLDRQHGLTNSSTLVDGFGEWNETFSFAFLTSKSAECAQLYIEVIRGGVDVVASRAFPLKRLRSGLGTLNLHDPASQTEARVGDLLCNLDMLEVTNLSSTSSNPDLKCPHSTSLFWRLF